MNLFFTFLFATCALAYPQWDQVSDPLASPLKLSEPPAGRGWGGDEKTETLPIEVLKTEQVSINNCTSCFFGVQFAVSVPFHRSYLVANQEI